MEFIATEVEEKSFGEFRRKVRASALLSAAMVQLLNALHFTGRVSMEALDRLSRMFLDGGLLQVFEEPKSRTRKPCPEEEIDENFVSSCKEDE
jgi:hypothetical protein